MNAFARTVSTLASLRRAIGECGVEAELIVVDNGSTDGLTEWLSIQPDIRLIANGCNLGVSRGRNIGVDAARYDRILFLDNDVDLKPHAIPMFDLKLDERHNGIVGDSGSVLIPEWVSSGQISHDTSDGNFPGNNFIVGYCMAVRRDVIDAVGPFDEDYPPFYWEDIDYGIRVRKFGYDLAVVSETCYHHKRASVSVSNREQYVMSVEREGCARTMAKHGRDCPVWVLASDVSGGDVDDLERQLADIRPNIITHVVSPDLSVMERRPWRVVLPGEMYPRESYSRICHWDGRWHIGPEYVPVRDRIIADLNDPISRRPW